MGVQTISARPTAVTSPSATLRSRHASTEVTTTVVFVFKQ